jgi:hypothetical protein
MNEAEREAIAGIMAMMLQLLIESEGKNQRKWQNDWNRHAKVLEGRVPIYPKKLVR